VIQQLKNAFPFESAPKYLIFDRDSIFSVRVKQFITNMGTSPKVTGYKCPWQNGVAERYVLSVREDALNRMVIFNEKQLHDLMWKQRFKIQPNSSVKNQPSSRIDKPLRHWR